MDTVLIYGSYGYTGELITQRAVDAGIDLRVAGRDASEIERQKRDLGVGGEVFTLDETDRMHTALDDTDVLLNCAGPFVHTAESLVDACLATETDYLDITGEFQVFKDIAERDTEATEAGVTLMPGVSFDVVTTDSMAAYLYRQLPSATELSLGIYSKMPVWEFAGGSLASGIEHAANDSGGALLGNTVVRREGELEVHRPAWKSREIDFGYETTPAVTIPWGDVVTAYHTTNIPNIDVYMGVSRSERGDAEEHAVPQMVLQDRPGSACRCVGGATNRVRPVSRDPGCRCDRILGPGVRSRRKHGIRTVSGTRGVRDEHGDCDSYA